MQHSTEPLSTEDVSLLQGLQKKEHVVFYTIAVLIAVAVLVPVCLSFGSGKPVAGPVIWSLSGIILFIAFVGWNMQRQYQRLKAYIDKGEKQVFSGIVRDVVRNGYDRVRYHFGNNHKVDVYIPLDRQHKRALQSIASVKNCSVILHVTTGDKPILLQVAYPDQPATMELQPATEQDRKQFLKGQKTIAYFVGICLVVIFLVVGLLGEWSVEALIFCFCIPALFTVFLVFLFYMLELRLAAKMTERLTVTGTLNEIIVARVRSGKQNSWHSFYRVGLHTFDAGTVSKAIPGDSIRVDCLCMKDGKIRRIISIQLNGDAAHGKIKN